MPRQTASQQWIRPTSDEVNDYLLSQLHQTAIALANAGETEADNALMAFDHAVTEFRWFQTQDAITFDLLSRVERWRDQATAEG